MHLSELLTGFCADDLDPDVGRQIMAACDRSALDTLLQRAQGCRTLVDLELTVLLDPAQRKLADEILEAWFTGVVSTPNGPVVATFMGALAWQCIRYTGAPSACHEPWWSHPVAPS